MSNDSKSFLSGGGPAALKFEKVGTSHTVTICEPEPKESQQVDPKDGTLKTWKDGNPMMQLVIHVQTDKPEDEDDDGIRRVFVKGQMRKAFQAALQEAGVDELLVGGKLTIVYTHDGERSNPVFSPPKQYVVSYVPPTTVSTNGSGALTATGEVASTPMPANLPKGMTQEVWDSLSADAKAALTAL